MNSAKQKLQLLSYTVSKMRFHCLHSRLPHQYKSNYFSSGPYMVDRTHTSICIPAASMDIYNAENIQLFDFTGLRTYYANFRQIISI